LQLEWVFLDEHFEILGEGLEEVKLDAADPSAKRETVINLVQ
jgi:hypothetical protein